MSTSRLGACRAARALARVEARSLRRHPARSLLVVALVAVPIAALVAGIVFVATAGATTAERRAAAVGAADLRVDVADAAALAAVRAELPRTARSAALRVGMAEVFTPGRRVRARAFALESGAPPLWDGLLRVVSGELPAGPGAVGLSPALAAAAGVELGGEVEVDGAPVRVAGAVVDPEALDLPVLVRAWDLAGVDGTTVLLVALDEVADVPALASRLRARGHRTTVRSEAGASDGFEDVAVFVVGGFAVAEASLVAGAAFAVSLRRRRRELGLLAACGSTPRALWLAGTGSAVACGLVGAAVGLVAGVALAAFAHPWYDAWTQRWCGPLVLPWGRLAGATALGVVAPGIATAWPTAVAARLPVLVALGAKRPVPGSSSGSAATGVALALVGALLVSLAGQVEDGAAAALVLAGSVAGLVGLALASPWLLHVLARSAGRLPLAWRLAARDAGRFRKRNGPAVVAVCAGMAVPVLVGGLASSVEALAEDAGGTLRPDQLLFEGPGAAAAARAALRELDASVAAPLRAAHAGGEPVRAPGDAEAAEGWLAVGEPASLLALGVDAPRAGGGEPLRFVHAAGEEPSARGWRTSDGRTLALPPARVVPVSTLRGVAGHVGPEAATAAGLTAGPPPGALEMPWLVRLQEPVSAAVLERARSLAAREPGTSVTAERALRGAPRRALRAVALAAVATALLVVWIAAGLSAAEAADDARTLHAVGAAPRVLRAYKAARAGVLAGAGALLALPAGLLPLVGLLRLADVPLAWRLSWTVLAGTTLALPAVAYATTWCVAAIRAARPHRPRSQLSTS